MRGLLYFILMFAVCKTTSHGATEIQSTHLTLGDVFCEMQPCLKGAEFYGESFRTTCEIFRGLHSDDKIFATRFFTATKETYYLNGAEDDQLVTKLHDYFNLEISAFPINKSFLIYTILKPDGNPLASLILLFSDSSSELPPLLKDFDFFDMEKRKVRFIKKYGDALHAVFDLFLHSVRDGYSTKAQRDAVSSSSLDACRDSKAVDILKTFLHEKRLDDFVTFLTGQKQIKDPMKNAMMNYLPNLLPRYGDLRSPDEALHVFKTELAIATEIFRHIGLNIKRFSAFAIMIMGCSRIEYENFETRSKKPQIPTSNTRFRRRLSSESDYEFSACALEALENFRAHLLRVLCEKSMDSRIPFLNALFDIRRELLIPTE